MSSYHCLDPGNRKIIPCSSLVKIVISLIYAFGICLFSKASPPPPLCTCKLDMFKHLECEGRNNKKHEGK